MENSEYPKLNIGLSGWSYGNWKGDFYPEKLPSAKFLGHYATVFPVVEVNSSFYHMPRESTLQKWKDETPEGFRFCPKISRFITHMKKLRDAEAPVALFMERFMVLKEKLGPILIQLPASRPFEREVAEDFYKVLAAYKDGWRFALEARHDTWFTEESIYLMQQYNITFAIGDAPQRFPYRELFTSNQVYLRMHGPERLYYSEYSESRLQEIADKIRSWLKEGMEVFVFFNNTAGGFAIPNALRLRELAEAKKQARRTKR